MKVKRISFVLIIMLIIVPTYTYFINWGMAFDAADEMWPMAQYLRLSLTRRNIHFILLLLTYLPLIMLLRQSNQVTKGIIYSLFFTYTIYVVALLFNAFLDLHYMSRGLKFGESLIAIYTLPFSYLTSFVIIYLIPILNLALSVSIYFMIRRNKLLNINKQGTLA